MWQDNHASDFPIIQDTLRKAWGRDTAHKPGAWRKSNPAIGQCAVSSLVAAVLIQRLFKSTGRDPSKANIRMHKVKVERAWHYFLTAGPQDMVIDFTAEQLAGKASPAYFLAPTYEVDMASVMDNCAARFEILMGRFLDLTNEVSRSPAKPGGD